MVSRDRPCTSIILPYLNQYRIGFLKRLRTELDALHIDLGVYAGLPYGADRARLDEIRGANVTQLRQIQISSGAFSAQFRVPTKQLLRSDLIIFDQGLRNLDAYLLLIRRLAVKQRVALWGHGYTITKPQLRIARLLQRAMLHSTDWFFAYTEGSARRAEHLGVSRERITVVNNAIDSVTADPHELLVARHELRSTLPSDAFIGTCIGAMDHVRRLPFLLHSFQEAVKTDPRLHLVVAGSGPASEYLKELATRKTWLTVLGPVHGASKHALLERTKFIAMPGRVGLVAVDSFHHGTPILTTDWPYHGPEYEYLTAQDSVTVPDDRVAYSIAIRRLAQEPRELERLSSNAAARAAEFTVERMAHAFAQGIRQVLS